jgi:hypothetical protein
MSIFGSLKKMFAKDQAPEVSLEILSLMPVHQLVKGDAPFNSWMPPDLSVPQSLRDTFEGTAWMYQMYTFWTLLAERFGYDIAERALGYQTARLGRISSETAATLTQCVRRYHQISSEEIENPTIFPAPNGQAIPLGPEYRIALEALCGNVDSPFYVSPERLRCGVSPDLKDNDFLLLQCLVHSRDQVRRYFEPMVKLAKVVL